MSLDAFTPHAPGGPVFFDRRELDLILRVYGRMVAAGEWRDYAMAGHRDVAEFAVFRRSGDAPAFRIEKRPALRLRQGQWAVIGDGGVLSRPGTAQQLIVDSSTISEEASATVQEAAAKVGCAVLAAPVSGNAKVVKPGRRRFRRRTRRPPGART